MDWRKRCDVCGWPLAKDRSEGCVVGDCSYRGRDQIGMVPEHERKIREDCRKAEAEAKRLRERVDLLEGRLHEVIDGRA